MKKSRWWEPFGICPLYSTINPAQFESIWARLAVLFSLYMNCKQFPHYQYFQFSCVKAIMFLEVKTAKIYPKSLQRRAAYSSSIGNCPHPPAKMAVFDQFSAIYMNIFHKTETQTAILRCWMGLYLNWFKSYDTKCKCIFLDLATLVCRIDVHARLLILRKNSPLHGLILVCTFIVFEKKISYMCIGICPARLLILRKKSPLHGLIWVCTFNVF